MSFLSKINNLGLICGWLEERIALLEAALSCAFSSRRCVIVHDWTADVSPMGHSVSAHFIWTLPSLSLSFFFQRWRAVTRSLVLQKKKERKKEKKKRKLFEEEKEGKEEQEEEEGKKVGNCFKTVPVLTGELSSSAPQISPPFSSLNGWASLGLCSSAQAKRLEATCEYPSVWRLDGNAQKCPAASLELHSEDFSPAFVPFFFFQGEGVLLKVYSREGKVGAAAAALTP